MAHVFTPARRLLLLLVLPVVLAACGPETVDDPSSPTEGSEESLSIGRICHADSDCPHSNLCRLCDDGSTACASAACVHGRCVAHAPVCPPPGPKVFCGGIAGIPCPGAGQCTDDPSDSCDPKNGGVDCGGQCVCGPERELCRVGSHWDGSPTTCACVPDVVVGPKVFCGGIAGIPCPGAGQCTDDPSDSCDPKNGGADCGGQCVCGPERVLCRVGSHWDGSPATCACVPDVVVGPQCGDNVCGKGTYCCNASCGICAPMGAACIQIACLPKE